MKRSAQSSGDAHTVQRELAGEVLRSSGSLHLRVTGWSMLPTVWPDDTLVIEQASGDQIFAGDIVMFSSGLRFVAHRVVAIGNGSGGSSVQTQGDAVPRADAPLAAGDLLGKVSFIVRNEKCIEPSRRRRISERAVAALFRRSSFAARVVVGIRGRLQKLDGPSAVPTSQVQASRIQTASP
ncbi:MAG TPA: hypothetical protein VKF84_12105 [Candidatus Sulfotelmatobacter sp.]|nr:hypothetical protein [Candidatus Sulfotelmatobacter sp.]